MIKWFKICRFLRKMRAKHNRPDFRIITTSSQIIIYVDESEDALRLDW